ncbi:MAG: stage II sporulation protein M [Flavobacteriales bacterium]
MREVAFIKQNKQKWLDFEKALFGKTKKTPDELADLFIHLTNDLAYAQTYYPKSKTIQYLNDLSARAFHKIYKSRTTGWGQISYFFKYDLPLTLYRNRHYMLIAFIIFIFFMMVGVYSSIQDPIYIEEVLGTYYVEMTKENIEDGDPLGVYKTGTAFDSFIKIALNNLRISVMVFTSGIIAGIGSIYFAFKNGIMVGTFQYLFHKEGLLWESAVGIWMHGAFEIFSIVIALMSGLMLGGSLLFPKSYSRKQSIRNGAADAIKVYISTIPFIAIAAFIEGYITRFADEMIWLPKLIISLGTLLFIIWYYVFYPRQLQRKTLNFVED